MATSSAQDADPDATGSFSEQKVKPSSLKFSELDLSSGGASESKSFTVTDSGTESLTVTVGNPSSAEFMITQGAGQTALQPKGVLTVMVRFQPGAAGKFKGTISVSSQATKGKTSASVKLAGAAKGALPPTATPTATPTGMSGTPTATPSATMTPTPTATATVSAGNSIFVTNFAFIPQKNIGDSITGYPVTGNGNVAPSININGSNPALFEPDGIALDSKGDVYVVNETGGLSGNGSVTEYAAGHTGNATPIATISGPDTDLDDPQFIALDSQANIYVTNFTGTLGPIDGGGITIYPAGSDGDTTPMATIYSSTVLGPLVNPIGIAVDQVSGNIFVATLQDGIIEYPPESNGAATPTAVIAGSNTGLGNAAFGLPEGLALNPVNGDIYVAGSLGAILAFPAGSNGNIQPNADIRGPATGLSEAQGVAVDSSGTIYVTNPIGSTEIPFGTITVYPPGSNGNVTPSATIGGSNTLLADPFGIAIGP